MTAPLSPTAVWLALSIGFGAATAGAASAGMPAAPSRAGAETPGGPAEEELLFAQGNCSAAASQAAAEQGGEVLSVSSSSQDGQTVCVVTLLVPGQDGGRPRRVTVTVPG